MFCFRDFVVESKDLGILRPIKKPVFKNRIYQPIFFFFQIQKHKQISLTFIMCNLCVLTEIIWQCSLKINLFYCHNILWITCLHSYSTRCCSCAVSAPNACRQQGSCRALVDTLCNLNIYNTLKDVSPLATFLF